MLSFFRNKKAMELKVLGYWIIGAIALAILVFAYIAAKNHGTSLLEFIRNFLRLH